jgi:precorrin-2 methylase
MVNQWVDFLKNYAKDNNMTYSCAISDKSASVAYRNMKKELNEMDMEDFDAPNIVKIKKQVKKQQQPKTKNPWIQFVKEFSEENNLPWNVALKEAKQFYKK